MNLMRTLTNNSSTKLKRSPRAKRGAKGLVSKIMRIWRWMSIVKRAQTSEAHASGPN
jgi:hypothetical protein